MKITIPPGAFHKAALKKRGAQSGEAEGSRKRPRSRSPPASRADPKLPTPPPPPRRSPRPSPPLPPRRSPTPLPPPRSPIPLPSQEPTSLTLAAPHVESGAPGGQPTDAPRPTIVEPSPSKAPGAGDGAPPEKRRKVVVGGGARSIAPEPPRDKMNPVPSRPSVMNHHHVAEKILSAASSPAIREEIRQTNPRILFREGQTAMLRVVNTFNQALAHVASGERRVERLRREVAECQRRATQAEDALKLAQAGEAERLEIVRSRARAETDASHLQMRKALERALTAEAKFVASETELAEVKAQLETAKSELKSSEEKTEIAEEVARLADIRIAEAAEASRAADMRSAEAAEAMKAAKAAEEKTAETVLKAVETYKQSPIFVEEVAEAGADAYLQGFYCCRDKAARVSGVEGLKELEPEEGDLGKEGAEEDPASADDVVPLSNSTPATE